MINRKDLKVGLVTDDEKVVTAIGNRYLLYMCEDEEITVRINTFCENYSIKKKKVEVVLWANYRKGDCLPFIYKSKEDAENCGYDDNAIAVAVELRGSYEI